MDAEVVNISSFKVVGFEYSGDKLSSKILGLWSKLNDRQEEIEHQKSPVEYISICDFVSEDIKDEGITFLAGVEVTDFGNFLSKMKRKVISEGTYAIFTHKGPIIEIGKTFEYIYGAWMFESGYEILQQPCFSYYDQRFKFNSKKSELDLYIPVK